MTLSCWSGRLLIIKFIFTQLGVNDYKAGQSLPYSSGDPLVIKFMLISDSHLMLISPSCQCCYVDPVALVSHLFLSTGKWMITKLDKACHIYLVISLSFNSLSFSSCQCHHVDLVASPLSNSCWFLLAINIWLSSLTTLSYWSGSLLVVEFVSISAYVAANI